MRIQNIADKIRSMNGAYNLQFHQHKDDSRYILLLRGTVGGFQIEAIDYVSPSPLAADAAVASICVKRPEDPRWMVLRTIGALEQLALRGDMR